MNMIQRLILLAAISVTVIMAIYPPWVCTVPVTRGIYVLDKYRVIDVGYALITSPPSHYQRVNSQDTYTYTATIDLKRLGVQWAGVPIATVGLLLIFKSKKADGKSSSASA